MTVLTEAEIVRGLVAQGVPQAVAEKRAREENPEFAAKHEADVVRRANVLEKAEQNAIRKMALAVGFKVYTLSQPRATKQTPGLPDLWLAHYERRIVSWWETKRQVGGALSSAQQEFAHECQRAGMKYGFGDRFHFAEHLTVMGFTPPAIPHD